jgi:hypothetical protein
MNILDLTPQQLAVIQPEVADDLLISRDTIGLQALKSSRAL